MKIDDLKQEFADPGNAYRILPLLRTNDEIDGEKMDFQIRTLKQKGCGGAFAYCESANGEQTPKFLSDWWWGVYEKMAQVCTREGIELWVYDEEDFPSGSVGGTLCEKHPETCWKYLHPDEHRFTGPTKTEIEIKDEIIVGAANIPPTQCGDDGTVYLTGDVDEDCDVDLNDTAVLANDYGKCSDPADPCCDAYYTKNQTYPIPVITSGLPGLWLDYEEPNDMWDINYGGIHDASLNWDYALAEAGIATSPTKNDRNLYGISSDSDDPCDPCTWTPLGESNDWVVQFIFRLNEETWSQPIQLGGNDEDIIALTKDDTLGLAYFTVGDAPGGTAPNGVRNIDLAAGGWHTLSIHFKADILAGADPNIGPIDIYMDDVRILDSQHSRDGGYVLDTLNIKGPMSYEDIKVGQTLTWGPVACDDLGTVYLPGDVSRDCQVGLEDLTMLVDDWLLCTDPADTGCDAYWTWP